MTEVRLGFKEMCARFEVTPRTLRYYEYIELLAPEKAGRTRFYGPREVARMTLILRGRRFGFSLEEIRQWLDIYQQQGTRPQLEAWLQMADRQLLALEAQQAQLAASITDLRALRTAAAATLDDSVADNSVADNSVEKHSREKDNAAKRGAAKDSAEN